MIPTEAQEGEVLVAWLRVHNITFSHIPNETGHTPEALRRAVRMKRQGTSKGFPDYVIALPGIGILYIELKRQKGSVVSAEQRAWIDVLNGCPGAEATIAKGADEAITFIESFMPKLASENLPF